ncbi:hypothetical protein JNX00_06965 [Hydrogenophaga sp. YM1]|uniref:hypothetical protein n=1 Tax=Hydrogenophaga sp. YM1 TaxID=2806262 RepID=UPI00195788B4|nr:hypothetical protein [Hydrogenophaga sp. YM1]QRR35599.1 hypothetical protein JNX00_06965 [Hydrogenophaga sp. YM1]
MSRPFFTFPINAAFERHISQGSFVSHEYLDAASRAQLGKSEVPILRLQLNKSVLTGKHTLGHGLVRTRDCNLFFFEVWRGNSCSSFLLNLADPVVAQAFEAWDKAGFCRVMLVGPDKRLALMKGDFSIESAVGNALEESRDKPGFLDAVLRHFHILAEPGFIESMIADRTGRLPGKVDMGFVITEHSNPGLPEATATPAGPDDLVH